MLNLPAQNAKTRIYILWNRQTSQEYSNQILNSRDKNSKFSSLNFWNLMTEVFKKTYKPDLFNPSDERVNKKLRTLQETSKF